jgi:hypothetical protein
MDIHSLFNHSSVDRHLGDFYFLAIMNNAIVNICVQMVQYQYALSYLVYSWNGNTRS